MEKTCGHVTQWCESTENRGKEKAGSERWMLKRFRFFFFKDEKYLGGLWFMCRGESAESYRGSPGWGDLVESSLLMAQIFQLEMQHLENPELHQHLQRRVPGRQSKEDTREKQWIIHTVCLFFFYWSSHLLWITRGFTAQRSKEVQPSLVFRRKERRRVHSAVAARRLVSPRGAVKMHRGAVWKEQKWKRSADKEGTEPGTAERRREDVISPLPKEQRASGEVTAETVGWLCD